MRRSVAILLLALPAISGCTGNFKPDADHGPLRTQIVDTAMAQVGVPYKFAGADPQTGFDCSGLALYSYAKAGVKLPRSSSEQMAAGHEIPYRDAQPGDLLFYRFDSQKLTESGLHVVLYTGGIAGVHAPGGGRGVSIVRLDQPAWTSRFVTAVNVVADLPPSPPIAPSAPQAEPMPVPESPAPAVPAEPAPVDAPVADTAPAQTNGLNAPADDYGAKENTSPPPDTPYGASILRP